MNPDFIHFKEIALDDNNKSVLDFSDEEFIQKINFKKNFNYYIASLDCNLILKEHIKKDKKNGGIISKKALHIKMILVI